MEERKKKETRWKDWRWQPLVALDQHKKMPSLFLLGTQQHKKRIRWNLNAIELANPKNKIVSRSFIVPCSLFPCCCCCRYYCLLLLLLFCSSGHRRPLFIEHSVCNKGFQCNEVQMVTRWIDSDMFFVVRNACCWFLCWQIGIWCSIVFFDSSMK